jgi:branched-chain amino acid transport system substrate-binding protein
MKKKTRVVVDTATKGLIATAVIVCGMTHSLYASAAGPKEKTIVVGTTNPLSGVAASACKPVSDATVAWFDMVNSKGGVNGYRIQSRVLDDQYRAPQALANARTFVSEDVFAVIGGCGTIQPPAIYKVLERAGIPYLFPYASLNELVNPVKPTTFALLPLYGEQMSGLVRHVAKELGAGSMYGIYTKVPNVEEAIDENRKAAEGVGMGWQGHQVITPGATDFTPIVLRLKEQNPDYVVLNTLEPDAGRLFIAMRAQGWFPKRILGTSAISSGSAIKVLGKDLDGKLLAVSPTVPMDTPDAQECAEVLKKGGVAINGFSLYGCGIAQVFVHALSNTGPEPTRQGLIKTLEGWKDEVISPLLPPVSFSASNHMGEQRMFVVGVKHGAPAVEGTVDITDGKTSN